MDLTQGTVKEKNERAKKMMLWFGMISIAMTFAGLTSAYIVSKERPDWLKDFELPSAFYISTIVILASSVTFHLAKNAIQKDDRKQTTLMLLLTLILGAVFVVCQFIGFGQIIEAGYYFTGSQSNITMTFVYILTVVHIAHVVAGIVVLLVVIYNHFKQRYKQGETLGIELGVMFWHFLDFLWLWLFVLLYFIR